MQINVTVENYGDFTETFSVTIYAQTTVIGILTVNNLFERTHAVLTYQWNTTGFAKGYYSISAYAYPVPGETHTTDNTYADGDVIVALVGDITGPTPNVPDGEIDTRDIATVAAHFGDSPPDGHTQSTPEYIACFNCDITGPTAGVPDGKIDIRDIFAMAKRFGQVDP